MENNNFDIEKFYEPEIISLTNSLKRIGMIISLSDCGTEIKKIEKLNQCYLDIAKQLEYIKTHIVNYKENCTQVYENDNCMLLNVDSIN